MRILYSLAAMLAVLVASCASPANILTYGDQCDVEVRPQSGHPTLTVGWPFSDDDFVFALRESVDWVWGNGPNDRTSLALADSPFAVNVAFTAGAGQVTIGTETHPAIVNDVSFTYDSVTVEIPPTPDSVILWLQHGQRVYKVFLEDQ